MHQVQALLLQHLQRFPGGRQHLIIEGLKVAAEVGQRGAQLMGHIGNHVFAQLLDPLQAVGHPVEGPAEITDLVAGLDVDTGRVIARGNLFGNQRHLRQGAQHPPGQQKTEQGGSQQGYQAGPDQIMMDRGEEHGMDLGG